MSVVIPVRNDARRLAVCMQSLRSQAYPAGDYEIVVVDNGSTDDSRAVAERHGAAVLCFPGLRVGALRNRGVAASRGEMLAFVDSDHEVPANWLAAGEQELQAAEAPRIVGSPYLAPPAGAWVQRIWELHRLRDRTRRPVAWLATGNLFIRRRDFDRLGGFREDLVAAEDVDLCVRMAAVGGEAISDMRLANVHHGEPATLRLFFRKEYWRGSSGVRTFFAHGMPWHELPSLAFPAYHLVVLLLTLVAGFGYVVAGEGGPWLVGAAIALLAPSLMLGIKTAWQARRPLAFAPLAVLYFTYALARAAALFKR